MIADCYWRDRLTDEGKKIYDEICLALNRGENRAVARIRGTNAAQGAMRAVLFDKPQYFWFNNSVRFSMSFRGSYIEWTPLYQQREFPTIERAFQSAIAACRGNGELETEKKIAEYLVRSVRYRVESTHNQNAAAALCFKEAQCSGFAAAVKYLCDNYGIWCIIVDGTVTDPSNGRKEPHAWNVIRIGGNYYHLDVTMMQGANTDTPKELRFMYFNYADAQMPNYVWDRASTPPCVTSSGGNPRAGGAQRENVGGNLHFSTLSELRSGIEKAYKEDKESLTFTLGVGESVDEKMKLITSSMRMVFSMLRKSINFRMSATGEILTIYFK